MRSSSEIRSGGSVTIHKTAIVHADAELGEGVSVGPFSIIEGTVKIGAGTKIGSHVVIEGHTQIGCDNEIYTGAVIGSQTQDKKFDGGISYLRIGDRNKIREYVTINPGTKEGTETVIGNDNLFMAYSHVAHDCIVHNNIVMANQATLAGHVEVFDRAIIGGLSGVHQFIRIGEMALIGGCSKVTLDIPPYTIVDGHPASVCGLNLVGLERAGFSVDEKSRLKKAYKLTFRSRLKLKDAIGRLEEKTEVSPAVATFVEFLKASEHGICR